MNVIKIEVYTHFNSNIVIMIGIWVNVAGIMII